MIMREFSKNGESSKSAVWLVDSSPRPPRWISIANYPFEFCPFEVRWEYLGVCPANSFRSARSAQAFFATKVAWLLKEGWTETPQSLTRRVFVFPSAKKPAKFWAVWHEFSTMVTQWGKVTGAAGDPLLHGKKTPKSFATPVAALAAYKKAIAAKVAEGYKEFWPRKTLEMRRSAQPETAD
jgi:predicted DNA-binding WGR domain protein